MALRLYAHPFSSYCWKALIAFYENDIAFEYRHVEHDGVMAELEGLWPLKCFPVLQDGDGVVVEATSIIEHLAVHYPGPVALVPADPEVAAEARMLDRIFDNYVATPQGKHVFDAMRAEGERDPRGVADAAAMLDTIYVWLDRRMQDRTWAVAESFTLADCAAAPHLFYADWTRPIPPELRALQAYRLRLLARPSVARCIEDARPYRAYFPLGAPDRD